MPSFHLLYKHLSNYTHPRMDVFIQMLKYLTWQVCKYLWAAKHQSMLALCRTSWQGLLVWVKLLANAGRLLHPKWHDCRVLLWNTQIHLLGSAQAAWAWALSLHSFLWNTAIFTSFTFTNSIVKKTQIRLKEMFHIRQKPSNTHAGIGMFHFRYTEIGQTGPKKAGKMQAYPHLHSTDHRKKLLLFSLLCFSPAFLCLFAISLA